MNLSVLIRFSVETRHVSLKQVSQQRGAIHRVDDTRAFPLDNDKRAAICRYPARCHPECVADDDSKFVACPDACMPVLEQFLFPNWR